ncbi:hypothetical protein SNEBB_010217 [Seison nebaliae]|nr:hypothetical protein SNEBB_010217 [Seison nebaliae]
MKLLLICGFLLYTLDEQLTVQAQYSLGKIAEIKNPIFQYPLRQANEKILKLMESPDQLPEKHLISKKQRSRMSSILHLLKGIAMNDESKIRSSRHALPLFEDGLRQYSDDNDQNPDDDDEFDVAKDERRRENMFKNWMNANDVPKLPKIFMRFGKK